MKRFLFLYGLLLLAVGAEAAAGITNLTLEQAVELAEESHPDLSEARAQEEASRARSGQAGKLPNPEVIARVESAPMKGRTGDSAEYVAGVSQTVPIGGRLSASRELARKEVETSEARTELRRRELHARVHTAFASALYFDAVLTTFSNNLSGARKVIAVTKARAEAGDALSEDVARAEIEEFQSRVELKAAEAASQLAMEDLHAAIGKSVGIVSVSGSLTNVLGLPAIESAAVELSQTPGVALANADAEAQRARLKLATTERIPDINFEVFYRRLQETRQDAFDVGIRVPMPLFTRSRVREAEAEVHAADARAASARLNSQQQFNRALSDLQRAVDAARTLSTEIMPRAQLVLAKAEARYKAGDESLAGVIQKRRDWNSTQVRYLQALRETHEAWRGVQTYLKTRRN